MFLATIPAVLYIDQFGRKPVLIAGAVGMGISHIIVAGLMGTYAADWLVGKAGAAGWAAVVFVWLYEVNFGYSWGVSQFLLTCSCETETYTETYHYCSPALGSLLRRSSRSECVQRVFPLVLHPTGSITLL
jgi:MFS family permease